MSENTQKQQTPPPIKTNSLLDSVLHEKGPMPSAKLGIRLLAFFMDLTLVAAVASIIIFKFALPSEFPQADEQFVSWWNDVYMPWASADIALSERIKNTPMLPESLEMALAAIFEMAFIICWFYFAIGEGFFNGRSVGKYACKLRSISTVTLSPPGVLAGIARGGLKTCALLFYPPFTIALTLSTILFNKRNQMGHDILSRTAVIDLKYAEEDQID